ncbi:MAG: AAA family ATPase [Chlamydiae bacterium]|nr:AAA family ATPase [Chlamydiota bacterium]
MSCCPLTSLRSFSLTNPFCVQRSPERIAFTDLKSRIASDLTTLTATNLSRSFTDLTTTQIEELLTIVTEKMSSIDDPEKQIEAFAALVPLEQLQDIVRQKYPSFQDALTDAKSKIAIAKDFLEKTKGPATPTAYSTASYCFDVMISIIESILSSFGVADFFKPADNAFSGDIKSQKIMSLMYFASFLTTTLVAFFAPPVVAIAVGGGLLTIAVLSLIFPLFKPMPSQLPEAKNYSRMFRMGELRGVEGRKKTLDEIARTLIESKSVKKHPLLVGKSGIGKTKAVEAFVKAVERGDYPELKGKQVFYFSTGNLVNAREMFSGANNILSRINEVIGRHRENIILVFDEIHEAAKEKAESASMSEQLKVMLDPGPGKFPYVIAMTTDEEYKKHIKGAFARRFKPIALESTDIPETVEILHNTLLSESPEVILEKGALEYMAERVRDVFGSRSKEPADSITVLTKCIQYVAKSQKTPLEERVEDLRQRVQGFVTSRTSTGIFALPDRELSSQIAEAQRELQALEVNLREEKDQVQKLFTQRDVLLSLQRKVCQIIAKTSLSARDTKELNFALLCTYFIAPSMEKKLLEKAAELGVGVRIDRALINRVIAEEEAAYIEAQRAEELAAPALLAV